MELNQIDDKTIRVSTNRGELVCSFSKKRFRKDNNELEKQVTRAKALVKKHEPGKRAKFISKEKTKDGYTLNEKLITKSKKLLGIKRLFNISHTARNRPLFVYFLPKFVTDIPISPPHLVRK